MAAAKTCRISAEGTPVGREPELRSPSPHTAPKRVRERLSTLERSREARHLTLAPIHDRPISLIPRAL